MFSFSVSPHNQIKISQYCMHNTNVYMMYTSKRKISILSELCHDKFDYTCTCYEGRKEGNVLFNDALNTFYLRLYGVRHMVNDK